MTTHIFRKQISFIIVINKNTRIPTLEPQRPKTPFIIIRPTNACSSRNTHLRFSITRTVDVHPEHVLPRGFVIHDFRSFDDAAGAEVARVGAREQGTFVFPFYKVGRGVAIYVLEGRAVGFVFADPGGGCELVVGGTMAGLVTSSRCR